VPGQRAVSGLRTTLAATLASPFIEPTLRVSLQILDLRLQPDSQPTISWSRQGGSTVKRRGT
jgi:hypothetical protein